MKMSILVFSLLLYVSKVMSSESVGFQQVQLMDDINRPLTVTLWYPTAQNTPLESVAENIAFVGTQVVKDAAISSQQHPLILISHGYRGSWRNLNWLAERLVNKGFVVAAPNHPGTTTRDHSAQQASQWWQRSHDLVRVLDHLQTDSVWRTVVDTKKVSAIGHSLGGWSVMQLVGAQFSRDRFLADCQKNPNPRTCGLARELGLTVVQPEEPHNTNLSDERIKKVITLDLGLARSFSITSMNNVTKPVLILGAGIDVGNLPQAMESGYLAEHLPLFSRHYKVYEQGMHFSFMQLCQPGAIAFLEAEMPGDGIVCKDGVGTSRDELHQQIFNDIDLFLKK